MSSNILMAYYSWSGTTAALAKQIDDQLHPDVYQIQVPAGTFSTDMYATSDIAKAQLAAGKMPKLVNAVPDPSHYDRVLIGGPVWSGTPATPVLAFLHAINSRSLAVAPFYTDVGNAGDYEVHFKQAAGNLDVLPGFEATGVTNQREMTDWLTEVTNANTNNGGK
ncbi:flavodoxin [Secundilactobacillus folii]|uniref:Flavodoxin n=1 Tax=Secundilactobacillus folii TaxID=2678357 RepID=A0A7X2XV78_9LACO|nr:flavodoxin [Secundilactobacillus folii]MTV82145.1 flavodoxin [Secundilactobacillus folii]